MAARQDIQMREGCWWRVRQRILRRWIQLSLPEMMGGWTLKTDLYDEACGPYHHLQGLGSGVRLLGIDRDMRVARAAKARLAAEGRACEILLCDVRSLPLAEGSMTLILSLSTLDHFESIRSIAASLEDIVRSLRRGGRLLLTLDNPNNPEVALRAWLPAMIVRRLRADQFPIGVTMRAGEAEALFRRHNLEVLGRSYLIHGFRYVAIRVSNWLAGRKMGALERTLESVLEALESLSRWPLRHVTGHYVGWQLWKGAPRAGEDLAP